MKKLAVADFGVMEMSAKEMEELNGGIDWGKLVKGNLFGIIAGQVVEHWSEIKVGFNAGYDAKI